MIGGLEPRIMQGGGLRADRAEVLRYLGYRPGVSVEGPRAAAAVDEGIERAQRVAEPRAALVDCAVDGVDAGGVRLVANLYFRSKRLARAWEKAHFVTLAAATIGPGIEGEVAALWQAQEYAVATAVDAAGSALIQAWLRQVGGSAGLSQPYSPGYGDWDLGDQRRILELTRAEEIGLSATETHYLVPQKSVVCAFAWLAPGGREIPLHGCAACSMRHCAYRRTPQGALKHGS